MIAVHAEVTEPSLPSGSVEIITLDLQLPMQSVPTTTDVVCSNLDYGEVYNIM
jgi:hypothetical protein